MKSRISDSDVIDNIYPCEKEVSLIVNSTVLFLKVSGWLMSEFLLRLPGE